MMYRGEEGDKGKGKRIEGEVVRGKVKNCILYTIGRFSLLKPLKVGGGKFGDFWGDAIAAFLGDGAYSTTFISGGGNSMRYVFEQVLRGVLWRRGALGGPIEPFRGVP